MTTSGTSTARPRRTRPRGHRALAIAPFIGVILFTITSIPIVAEHSGDWTLDLLQNGVVFLVGWAGIGAGISHLFVSRRTAESIGWAPSPFQHEVGYADLAMGVAGVMAGSQPPSFWLAVITVNAVFRVGCSIGHLRQIVEQHDHSPNNTAILLVDVGVPAFLVVGYLVWI